MNINITNPELKAICKRFYNNLNLGFYKNDIHRLEKVVVNILLTCENEKDIRESRIFLEPLFKENNILLDFDKFFDFSYINLLKADTKTKNINLYGENKSTKIIIENNKIKEVVSEYFIKYRPTEKELSNECDSFIRHLTKADFFRDQKHDDKLNTQFYKVLRTCKNEQELIELDTFFNILNKQGKYAEEFYYKIKNELTLDGINRAKDIFGEEKNQQIKINELVSDFERKYKLSKEKVIEFDNLTRVSEEDFEIFIQLFNQLDEDLNYIAPYLDRNKYYIYSNEIESYKNYFREKKSAFDDLFTL